MADRKIEDIGKKGIMTVEEVAESAADATEKKDIFIKK